MKNASIEKILSIEPIPNSDNIMLAKVLGWQSVVKKGDYSVGDYAVFVPIDTVLPDKEWSSFLKDKNHPDKPIRVKTAKLRGTISQGVIFPMSILECRPYAEGEDVAEELGITHYEKAAPVNQDAIGSFPSVFISKTDEDNVLSNTAAYDEMIACGFDVEATMKCDGTSGTIIVPLKGDGDAKVCSRNQELKDGNNVYWNMARKYKLVNGLFLGVAVQGEVVGVGIQGNPMGLSEVDFYVFNVKLLHSQYLLNPNELTKYCENCWLKKVPIVYSFKAGNIPTLADLQHFANELKYPNGKPAEGLVFRPVTNVYSPTLLKSLSFKIISQNYKD